MGFISEPIVAVATATGLGGIGIVRVSGKDLSQLIRDLFGKKLDPRKAELVKVQDHQEQVIDSGIALFFPSPNSFTGEDVLEFQGHGGTVVLNLVLQRILAVGQRLQMRVARPGEFSERAFLNNKIDLTQAEAIADLIEANSVAAIKSANRSLSGVFSKKINSLVEQLTHLRILVEATLDFPEEEIEFLENAHAKEQWQAIYEELLGVISVSKQGALLRNGALVVLAGAPNVGKSSLINQLAQQEVAIVTPIAGTTRDRIREEISLEGIPLQIVDTAGLRKSDDAVEKIGIERSWSAIKEADIVLFLRDASAANQEESEILFKEIHASLVQFQNQSAHVIEVWNKQDQMTHPGPQDRLYISAKSGFGIEALKKGILQILGWESHAEDLILARQRHIDALNKALKHLMNSQVYLSQGNASLELFAEELRLAQDELGEITGKLLPDDLLGKIFSSFCIGK